MRPRASLRETLGRGGDGFTLIEVLIAVAILGSALFILLQAHYVALRANTELRDEVMMRNLTAQAMGIAQTEVSAGNFQDSQEFGKRYPGFKYSFDAQAMGEEYPALYEVRITVEGPNVRREVRSFMLTRDPAAFLPSGTSPEGAAAGASGAGGLTRRGTQ